MSGLFASGRIIDLIVALTLLELLALVFYRRRTGRGLEPGALLAMLAPGLMLLIAVRLALTGERWPLIAGCLALALVAHLIDLTRRVARA